MIAVCGDSFNYDDPEMPGIHWTSKISEFTNLSIPGASNFVIRMQIDKAIKLKPDLIVVSFTSCLRDVIKYKSTDYNNTDLLDRIYTPGADSNSNLVSFPYAGAQYYDVLNDYQLNILKQYVTEFVDLDVARQQNYYLIKDALETLLQSGIKFCYSLGGFDHKSFCEHSHYDFSRYKMYETPINLWDYCEKQKTLRPWFHVTDSDIHNQLANYYKCLIKY